MPPFQILGGTLPCLSQTGKGFLLIFEVLLALPNKWQQKCRTSGAAAVFPDSGHVYSESGHLCRHLAQVAADVSDFRSSGTLLRQWARLLRQRPFLQILTTSGSRSVRLLE